MEASTINEVQTAPMYGSSQNEANFSSIRPGHKIALRTVLDVYRYEGNIINGYLNAPMVVEQICHHAVLISHSTTGQ